MYDKTDRTPSQLELIERLEKVVDILSGENKVRNAEEAYRQAKEILYGNRTDNPKSNDTGATEIKAEPQPQPTAQPKVQESPPQPQPQPQQEQPKTNEEKSHIVRVNKATHPGNMEETERKRTGNSILWLANKNGVAIPDKDVAALKKGSPNAISVWREKVLAPYQQQTVEQQAPAREAQQENVTRQEQPAQEDDRDVFDLLPESNELNDVESTERTEQRPHREIPQIAPQQVESPQETQSESQSETPVQIEPPKPKAKRSKKAAALHNYNHAIETENAPVNSAEPVSSNEALGFPPVGAFSTKTIPQDSDDDKANLKPHHPTREETKPESKSAEKETDEQQAIEELKAKTKAELEEIFETDKYPSIQEYLDDSFKNLEYESLEAAQRGRESVLKQARKFKADNYTAKFAAERMLIQWELSRPHNMSGLTEKADQEISKKALAVISKMRDGKITPEAALEKLDEILSGRAQKKLDAQRAKIRNEKESLVQETKTQLSEILDLDNHPALKEIIFKSLDQEANGSPVNSNKKLKEWCDNLIAQAKDIRDKGKIEEWEERAKERLPKKMETPESKPQPQVEPQAEKPAEQTEDIGKSEKTLPESEPKTESPAKTHKMPEFKTKGDITEQDLLDLVNQAWDKGMRAELEEIYNIAKERDFNQTGEAYDDMKAVFKAHQAEENSKSRNSKTPATIDECKSIDDIAAYWRAKYNPRIVFAPDLKELYFPYVKEFLKGVEEVFNLFPVIGKKVVRIDGVAPFFAGGRYSWDKTQISCAMHIGSYIFKTKEQADKAIKAEIPHQIKNFSTKAVGNHEAGHLLASALFRRAGYVETRSNFFGKLTNLHDSSLLYWAGELLSKTKKDELSKDELNKALAQISANATKESGQEIIADAIADFFTNREKAAPISKAIVQRIQEALKGDTWRERQIISKTSLLPDGRIKGNINTATVAKWYAARVAETKKQETIDAIFEKYKEKRAKLEEKIAIKRKQAELGKKGNKIYGKHSEWDTWLEEHIKEIGEKIAKLNEEQAAELRNLKDTSEIRKQAEQLLYDRGLAEELAKTKSSEEWEALLERRTPDEKILEQDGWTDAKINECAKDTHTANIIEQLGGKIKNGKVTFSNAEDKAAFTRFMELMVDPNARYDIEGDVSKINTDTSNTVAEKDLTPAQKLLVSFGKKLGVRVVFFDNPEGRFRGVHKEGYSLLNVNSNKALGKVFWHESLHWLRNNNQKLYQELVKAAGITDAQRKAYLEETGRTDITTPDEINEEILADMMNDVAKRTGLFQSIAGKNRGLIERVIQWFKDTLNKFIDHFRNPQGKLTTAQAQALADEFGRIANQLKDPNGNQIFRYNRRTHNVELADGREWSDAAIEEMTKKTAHHPAKYSFAGANAKTANKESLARAKKMDERGADRNRIYEATGWFKGKDGKWRFEIPDNFDQMDLDKLWWNEDTQFRLEEIYDNPALFEAYPKLRKVLISSKDIDSDGVTIGNKITLDFGVIDRDRKYAAQVLVHEIQHILQRYEKFASGGNPEYMDFLLNVNRKKIKARVSKKPDNAKYFYSILAAEKARKTGNENAIRTTTKTMQQSGQALSKNDKAEVETLAKRFVELRDVKTDTEEERIAAYERLGGEQEANIVAERLFNRTQHPRTHSYDALIIFGGKTYAMAKHSESSTNKKNASENGDGELVDDGSRTPPAATADGTTKRKPSETDVQADSKGGVRPSSANVETNSPSKSISQDSRADKPKFSIGADNESNFFRRAWNKFAKALHLKGDKIVTEEDKRRAQRQAQEKAMAAYLKEPTNKNMQVLKQLGVTKGQLEAYMNGEEYATDIGVIQNYRGSPSRIADKVSIFRAFFNMGDRAMDKLIKLRDSFTKHYGEAMALVKNKEDREQLVQLLWDGDEEQKEFTKEELLQDGVKENVADAYLAIRRQMRRAYTMLDEARRRPQSYAKHMDNDELKRLRDNKFVKQGTLKIHDKKDDKGNHLVTWTEYANHVRTYTVDGSARARFLADDAIQILEEQQLPDGTYKITVREGIPKLTDREGYVPHFFHEYTARVRDADGKQVGDIIGTGKTQREAIKLADEWLKNHQLEDGQQIFIQPHTFNFGMGENYAPIMGDKDFEVMMNRIAKNTGTTLAEAKQIVNGAVKLKNRHRFLGQLLKRKGYAGYEKDMDWVLRHHFNTVARYVALETEFKPKAISLFERVFGAFDRDYSKNLLAKYTKDYINDVNGVPTWVDDGLNKLIQSIPVVGREIFYPAFGKQGVQRLTYDIAGTVAALKLGMLNISSAMINFTQLINAAGYVGWQPLMRHFRSVVSRKGKLTMGETRILHESGILQDIGLDTPDGYDKNRMDNLLAKSMIIFQKCDSLCRISAGLAAFEKATNEGKNRAEALAYAKKVNRDANFSYGIEDAPNLMRRTGSIGKLALQFYKYPFKELEVMADFLPQNKKTTWKQKAAFWAPYLLVCGLTGIIPFFDWGDDWLNKHFGLFPKDFMQRTIMELSNGSEAERMIGKVIMYGAPALANIDVSKRTGLASFATPDSLFGAAGGTVWGVGENVLQGNFPNALRSFSPGLFNIYMAAVGGETHSARGRKMSSYEDAYSRLIRGLGFTSVDESVERDINRISFNAQSERTKLEQRAIDAYIADETAANRKRLEELGISAKRVKDERRRKKLGIIERRQENIPKKRRRDYEELFRFAQ